MQIPRRYDVFPSKVDTDPVPRLRPTFPLHDFITYVPYLHAEKSKMCFYHVGYGRMLSDNMQRTLSSALSPSTEWRKKFDWHHANTRLIIDWEANNPDKRCDTRLSFCSGNTFLVKTFFTFGKREVAPRGEVHVLQTTQAPLLFYLPKSQRRHIIDPQPERAFHSAHENFYDRYVLQPNSVYRISGGTSYLLMTSVKSLFSLHRVTPEVADRLESLWGVEYADPTSHTDYEGWRRSAAAQQRDDTDPYAKPPPSVMPLDYFVLPSPSDPCRSPAPKRSRASRPPVSKRPPPPPVFKQPAERELPIFKLPDPTPVFKLPAPKEPTPVLKEPLPVLAEPLVRLPEPLPVLAEPLPVSTLPVEPLVRLPEESLPALQEPLVQLPEESLPPLTKLPMPADGSTVVTNYVDSFLNMPALTDNGQWPVEPRPMFDTQMEAYPTFDTHLQMEAYPTFDTLLQMESYPMFDDIQTQNESLSTLRVFQPPSDASFRRDPFDAPAAAIPSNLPVESFRLPAADPTDSFLPFDELGQCDFGDYDSIDFESMFAGLSESTLQELGNDLEHLLQPVFQEGGI